MLVIGDIGNGFYCSQWIWNLDFDFKKCSTLHCTVEPTVRVQRNDLLPLPTIILDLIFEKPIEIPTSSFQWQGVISMTIQVSAPARTPGRNVPYGSSFG